MFDIEPFIQETLMGLQQAAIEILVLMGLFVVLGMIISIIISSGRK